MLRVKSKLRLSCKWEVFDLRMYKLHINDCRQNLALTRVAALTWGATYSKAR